MIRRIKTKKKKKYGEDIKTRVEKSSRFAYPATLVHDKDIILYYYLKCIGTSKITIQI